MLTSSTFQRDFTNAKSNVLELKSALHSFLDQEQQDKQEKMLENIEASTAETSAIVASMDDQLGQIKALLLAQAEDKAAKEGSSVQVMAEEESIFDSIARAAGVEGGDVPFKRFVLAFEAFFYGSSDMPPEQQRAMKHLLDKDATGDVIKPSWIKFYRLWSGSGSNIEDYLVKVAEENPSSYQRAHAKAGEAREAAAAAATAARERGAEAAIAAKAAREKGTEAANAAKEKGSALMSSGMGMAKGMFGGGK